MATADWVGLDDLNIDCVVGVLEREQRETQRIVATVRMAVPLEAAGESGDLGRSIDYGAVSSWIRMLSEHGRFRLLESLGLAACRLILSPPLHGEGRPQVDAVSITLRKPEVLAPTAVPVVHLHREAGAPLSSFEVAPGVWADILVDLPQGGAWRVRVQAGVRWEPPADVAVEVIHGAVEAGVGRTLRVGDRLARSGGELLALSTVGLLAVGRW